MSQKFTGLFYSMFDRLMDEIIEDLMNLSDKEILAGDEELVTPKEIKEATDVFKRAAKQAAQDYNRKRERAK